VKNVFSQNSLYWHFDAVNGEIRRELPLIRSFLYNAAQIGSIVSPVMLVVIDVIIALVGPKYDFLTQSISDLGLGPAGWLQSIVFFIFGITTISLASELYNELRGSSESRTGLIMMMFLGFGFVCLGLFRSDSVGATRSLHGIVHHFAAMAEGGLFPVSCFFYANIFRTKTSWRNLYGYSVFAGIMGCFFVVVWLIFEKNWFGLSERLIIINGLVWFEIIAIHLRRLSKSPHHINLCY
jgi:hypothetical membrane protein